MIWLKQLIAEMTDLPEKPILYLDCESAIKLSHDKPYEMHAKTKHIKRKHFFVRECVANNQLQVQHVPSERQLADMFTKALYKPRLDLLCSKIGCDKPMV